MKIKNLGLSLNSFSGFFWAHAQYSDVRLAWALCEVGFDGQMVRRQFLSHVEPVAFASEMATAEATARRGAQELSEVFRNDWLEAAPVCQ